MTFKHGTIQRELYGYLRGELTPETREVVRRHLDTCSSCAQTCHELESVLHDFPATGQPPSADLPPEYWISYLERIGESTGQKFHQVPRPSLREWLVAALWPNRRWAVAASGLAVFLGIVALFWRPWIAAPVPLTPLNTVAVDPTPDPVSHYLRRSKTLLVGLENMAPAAGGSIDVSPERDLSHKLLRDARRLREEPLDPGSARAMDDLEKILIEVANLDRRARPGDLDLIRNGMRQRNVLFKVRVAEQVRDSLLARNTRYVF